MYSSKCFSAFQRFTSVKKVGICLQLKDIAIRPDE